MSAAPLERLGRDDTEHGRSYYLAEHVDAREATLQAEIADLTHDVGEALAEIARLADDRDSWRQQASARTDDAVRFAGERDAALAEVALLREERDEARSGRDAARANMRDGVAREQALREAGAPMANMMFNLTQHEGRKLTGEWCAAFKAMQVKWDAATNQTKGT